MADGTKIEWSDATWNVITGCSVVSPGCTNCYAMRLAGTRMKNHPSRKGLTRASKAGPVWTGGIRFNEQWLDQPVRWKRPRMIFVCAHGDLFAEGVTDDMIDRVFAVMALCPQHIFQVLTKRPERMLAYIETDPGDRINSVAGTMMHWDDMPDDAQWPARNIWLGVSVEDQKRANERAPYMWSLSGAGWMTWVSYEPALGPVDWGSWEFIDWMVSGGESGPGARPSHPDWHRETRDWCAFYDIPYHFKQWGDWYPVNRSELNEYGEWLGGGPEPIIRSVDGTDECGYYCDEDHGHIDHRAHFMKRIGKKAAGRMLDGRIHDGFPEAVHV